MHMQRCTGNITSDILQLLGPNPTFLNWGHYDLSLKRFRAACRSHSGATTLTYESPDAFSDDHASIAAVEWADETLPHYSLAVYQVHSSIFQPKSSILLLRDSGLGSEVFRRDFSTTRPALCSLFELFYLPICLWSPRV
jgi:hypothetical protein